METRDHKDNVSEAFYSDTSGDPCAATLPNLGTAAGQPTTRPGLASAGAPGSNPGRPDLTIPDLSTPEGLATARMVLQRVVDGTSRTGQGAGLSWANLGQGQGASNANVQGTPVNQTTMGAYYSRATSVASSSVPQATGGANPVTPSPMVSNPMLGGAYMGLTSTAGATPMGYSTLVSPSTARSAIPTYGGYSLSGLPTANLPGLMNTTPMGFGPSMLPVGLATGTPQVGVQATVSAGGLTAQAPTATASTPGPSQSLPQEGTTPTTAGTTTTTAYRGMPSRIKNAVKMIQPFYSEGTTVEKARAFWNAFERATVGLEEQLRLSAFRECLKGKTAEDWWMYSLIPDFETLRTRFHNQFVCLTPLQMIERLKNAMRTKGMSAEVWGDLISGLCNEAQCYDPQMRYQYFLSGLRNREWKAALNTLMVNSIEGAVIVLLAKNMHQPVEDDADFVDAAPSKTPSESAAVLQMMQTLQQTQNLILQQQQDLARSPRSPRRPTYAAAAYEEPSQSSAPNLPANATAPRAPFRGIRQGPDQYTQDGQVVCGRCHILGCSRINCRRNSSTIVECVAISPWSARRPATRLETVEVLKTLVAAMANPVPVTRVSDPVTWWLSAPRYGPSRKRWRRPTKGDQALLGRGVRLRRDPNKTNNEGGKEERGVSPLPPARGATPDGAPLPRRRERES